MSDAESLLSLLKTNKDASSQIALLQVVMYCEMAAANLALNIVDQMAPERVVFLTTAESMIS